MLRALVHKLLSTSMALSMAMWMTTVARGDEPKPVDYIGINGRLACPADSNAVRINRGESLDGTSDWPVDCVNCISHALQVMDPSVVGEMKAGQNPQQPAKTSWTLRHLFSQIGGARGPGSAVADVLFSMRVEQKINDFPVDSRPDLDVFILQPWISDAGAVDVDDLVKRLNGESGEALAGAAWNVAPYKLVSIGYRPDLVRPNFESQRITSGGEGRFIFQSFTNKQFGNPQLLIFEYSLPAANEQELVAWTHEYDDLRKMPFGEAYNDKLESITKRFTDRNPNYTVPNNVSLGQLRTNELFKPGNFEWELREFRISHRGLIEPAAVQMNPDISFNSGSARKVLLDYLASADFSGAFPNTTIPWNFDEESFLGGSAITPVAFIGAQPDKKVDTWLANASEVTEQVRHRFASSTCNGCHGGDAPRTTAFTDKEGILIPKGFFLTGFTHVDARGARFGHVGDAIMSEFMCSSDLVARVAAFKLFTQEPAIILSSLFGSAKIEPFMLPPEDAASVQTGLSVIVKNLQRVH